MHAEHAVFSPPSAPGKTKLPPASTSQVAVDVSDAVPESVSGVPVSAVLVSPPVPESSPWVTSAVVPESPEVPPADELDEQPTALTLAPAPATIKRTTDKASFFIASPISP
jgi:hypothetical protein